MKNDGEEIPSVLAIDVKNLEKTTRRQAKARRLSGSETLAHGVKQGLVQKYASSHRVPRARRLSSDAKKEPMHGPRPETHAPTHQGKSKRDKLETKARLEKEAYLKNEKYRSHSRTRRPAWRSPIAIDAGITVKCATQVKTILRHPGGIVKLPPYKVRKLVDGWVICIDAGKKIAYFINENIIASDIAANDAGGNQYYAFRIIPEDADISVLTNTGNYLNGYMESRATPSSPWVSCVGTGQSIDFKLTVDGRISLRGDNSYTSLYQFLSQNAGGDASIFQIYDFVDDKWINTWTVPKISVLDDSLWNYFEINRGDMKVSFKFIYYPDLTASKIPISSLVQPDGTVKGRLIMDFGQDFTDPKTCTQSYFSTDVANVTMWSRNSAIQQSVITNTVPFEKTITLSSPFLSAQDLDSVIFDATGCDTFQVLDSLSRPLASPFTLAPGTSWSLPGGGSVSIGDYVRWVEIEDPSGNFVSLASFGDVANFKNDIKSLFLSPGSNQITIRGEVVSQFSFTNYRPSRVTVKWLPGDVSADVYYSS